MTDARPRTSVRDLRLLRQQIQTWIAKHVEAPSVSELVVPATTGMSSETVLFDLEFGPDDARQAEPCVLRLPPDPGASPVFPVYDMAKQFYAMRYVGAHSGVPVPPTLWLETDPSHLGAQFFVMRKVDGIVPPDVMPYTFGGNWFFDAPEVDQLRLQRASVETLAALHAIDASGPDAAFFNLDGPGADTLAVHVNDQLRFYEWVVDDGVRSPLIERTFRWLDDHWPATAFTPVISWGDARMGNILFRDFAPVAVLDWEMCALGPREIDLAWMIFLHRFFQDLAEQYGFPGLPNVMRLDDVAATYTAAGGTAPRDMLWFLTYAALRHAIVMFRITRRQIQFEGTTMPENPDHGFAHFATVEAMLDGTYWDRL